MSDTNPKPEGSTPPAGPVEAAPAAAAAPATGGTVTGTATPPAVEAAAATNAVKPAPPSTPAASATPIPSTEKVAVPFGAFMSVEYSRKYSVDVTASTTVTATLKSVPPPKALLDLITAFNKPAPNV